MGSVLKKVMFVGRATTFMVGLAVIVALTVGVAGAAFGANGANFLLGKSNAANAITQLVGSVAGPGLQIDNNSTDAAATALDLQVEAGKAPMKVNSDTQVANLNADKVDGLDASQLGGLSGVEQVGVAGPQNSDDIKVDIRDVPGGKDCYWRRGQDERLHRRGSPSREPSILLTSPRLGGRRPRAWPDRQGVDARCVRYLRARQPVALG